MSIAELTDQQILDLPLDRLALALLSDLVATDAWNTHNVLMGAQQHQRRTQPALQALAEAFGWLKSRNLIASPKPGQTSSDSMFVTRLGHQVLREGTQPLDAIERLGQGLHPALASVRSQFLLGEYELGAFEAMKQVEIAVRSASGLGNNRIGVALMRTAFHPESGPLRDADAEAGERQGLMDLFAGAIATFKNPSSHRHVEFDDPVVASEIIMLADLLLRLIES